MNPVRPAQRGFAAVVALFLVVVLAALGGFMLTFSNTQQLTSAQDVQGSRSYWAARAGLEWGIGLIIPQSAAAAACPASPTRLAGNGVDIQGTFTVEVTCTLRIFNEAGVDRKIFSLTSIANNAAPVGSVGFIERSLTASIEK